MTNFKRILRRELYGPATFAGVLVVCLLMLLAGSLVGFHFGREIGWNAACDEFGGQNYVPPEALPGEAPPRWEMMRTQRRSEK